MGERNYCDEQCQCRRSDNEKQVFLPNFPIELRSDECNVKDIPAQGTDRGSGMHASVVISHLRR